MWHDRVVHRSARRWSQNHDRSILPRTDKESKTVPETGTPEISQQVRHPRHLRSHPTRRVSYPTQCHGATEPSSSALTVSVRRFNGCPFINVLKWRATLAPQYTTLASLTTGTESIIRSVAGHVECFPRSAIANSFFTCNNWHSWATAWHKNVLFYPRATTDFCLPACILSLTFSP